MNEACRSGAPTPFELAVCLHPEAVPNTTVYWHKLGADLDINDFTDDQAVAAITRLTGGNFRLIQRLFTQIARVLTINELTVITADVVEAASSTVVFGAI